jgi:hypothetical protein
VEWGLFVASALSLALSVFALARSYGARSPATVRTRLDALEARAELWRATATELIERGEDVFSRVERKRASAAAAAARATAREDPSPPLTVPTNRAELRALRRAQRSPLDGPAPPLSEVG